MSTSYSDYATEFRRARQEMDRLIYDAEVISQQAVKRMDELNWINRQLDSDAGSTLNEHDYLMNLKVQVEAEIAWLHKQRDGIDTEMTRILTHQLRAFKGAITYPR